MACDILSGIAQRCKDNIGGLKKLYLFDYQEDPFTVSSGEATAINASITVVYEFILEGDPNTLTQEMVSDRNTKTTVNTQTVTATFGALSAADNINFDAISKGYPMGVVVDRNDNHHAIGIDDGIDFNISSQTGGAKTDLSGYTITGVSTTGSLGPILDSSTVTALEALV